MIISFSGIETPCHIQAPGVTTMEVHNAVLFTRICDSILLEQGRDAKEAFTLWDDAGEEISPAGQFLVTSNPLELPWKHKLLSGVLPQVLDSTLADDYELREKFEELYQQMNTLVSQMALPMYSEYQFEVDWDLKRYLKAFSYEVASDEDDTLLDKLIRFLLLAKDMSFKKTLVFINLKLFLSENELQTFFEQAFFSGIQILLLERIADSNEWAHEKKLVIDQDLLEH